MQTQALMNAVLDKIPIGVANYKILFDENGRAEDFELCKMNALFEKITGVESEAFLGKKASDFLPNFNTSNFNWSFFFKNEVCAGDGPPESFYSDVMKKWYRIESFNYDGQYFITLLIDMTREKGLLLNKGYLQHSPRATSENARSKVTYNQLTQISHEIRTPLDAVIGLGQLLKKTDLNKEQQEYIHIIMQSAKTVLDIVNKILEFSKIEARQSTLNRQKTNLKDLVQSTVDIFRYVSNKKGVEMTCYISPDSPAFVETDPVKLKEVLMNIIGNAVKFTAQGSIKINVQVIAINRVKKTVTVMFSIKDTGIGIKRENLRKIFKPYTQEDPSIQMKFGGTGLGLTISRQLLQTMNAFLTVNSKAGKGSTFSFLLEMPMFEEHRKNSKKRQKKATFKTETAHTQTKKIMIVEDTPINMYVIEKLIQAAVNNCQTITANNGIEAINTYEKEKPGLIFMDIVQPGMSGYECTRQIRKKDPKVPIIGITARIKDGERERCLKSGMNDFLIKPFSLAQLREIFKRYRL